MAESGHIDILGALLSVVSVAALARHWRSIGGVTFGLAVAVKFLPIVLVLPYWKRARIRDAAVAAAVVGLLYVPFLNRGRVPTGSLGTYGWPLQPGLRAIEAEWSPNLFVWPRQHRFGAQRSYSPWYLLWLLPFLTSASTLLIIMWTVSMIPTHVMWHLRSVTGACGALPGWVMLLEYGCVAIAAVIIRLRRITRSGHTAMASGPTG